MTERTQKLLEEVLALPVEEQADLFDELTARIHGDHHGFASPEIAEEWGNEIARRLDDIDSGRVKPISREEFSKRLAHPEDGIRRLCL